MHTKSWLPPFQLRTLLTINAIALVIIISAVLGSLGYHSARETIIDHAKQTVGAVADARKQFLIEVLRHRREVTKAIFKYVSLSCGGLNEKNGSCISRVLAQETAASPAIEGIALRLPKATFSAGKPINNLLINSIIKVSPQSLQLAYFIRGDHGNPNFFTWVSSQDRKVFMVIKNNVSEVTSVFQSHAGLGQSGEAFLTDRVGMFLTPSRYGNMHWGVSHPFAANPMTQCLSGRSGESVDLDYRGVSVIHGFRPVPEVDNGCVMAHIDAKEAFAPLNGLLVKFGIATLLMMSVGILLSSAFIHYVSRPLHLLTVHAQNLSDGSLETFQSIKGIKEVRHLAGAFNTMVRKLDGRQREIIDKQRSLENVNRELREFAHVVSHDLKSPLCTITGYIDLILLEHSKELSQEIKKMMSAVLKLAGRMRNLIDSLLIRAERGSTQRDFSRTNLNDVLDDVIENLQEKIEAAGAQIIREPMPEVKCDPVGLAQVFQNLIDNGLKYRSPNIKPKIEIGVRPINGDQLQFFIADNGIGFPQDIAEQVFKPFSRLQSAQQYEGTGIGLATCKKIVELHNGRIWVTSAPGKGSTFYFTIPCESAARQFLSNVVAT